MPIGKFLLYSVVGTGIWDAILIGFGYYVHGVTDLRLVTAALVAFGIVLCAVYLIAIGKINRKKG